jgi:hypothetical protein
MSVKTFVMAQYDITNGNWILSDLMLKLKQEKFAANELQKRKHIDWVDNYDLYRGKVMTNRLTQRQAVNIPLMKETIKTILSKIDDPPSIEWQELSGDEEKEIVYQEVWNYASKEYAFELLDILDKKNVLLYGYSVKKLNIDEDGICADVLDVYDIVFDPLMTPGRIETARFLIHQNIFKSVREILADSRYTAEGKASLRMWADSPAGIVQSSESRKHWEEKMKRLQDIGVTSDKFALYAGGDRIANMTEHYYNFWNKDGQKWERRVCSYVEDTIELADNKLYDLIGVEFWPFVYWSEDPETQDVYPDSVADLVRVPNKVVNVWYSQLIENRTLSNFKMHWFMPGQNYTPQTYQPGPGVMLPAPPGDDIRKVIMPVEIDGLDDTLAAINAITQIVERGTGATALEKGETAQGTQTLGEVQILVGKAMERTIGIAKFYKLANYEFAYKWDKLMHANAPKFLKLYKTSASGKIYPKRVYAGDWVSKFGYEPIVRSTSEQEAESTKTIQKFMFVMSQFPGNKALRNIAQKRELEMLNLTPAELKQVEEAQVEADQMAAMSATGADPNAVDPALASQVKSQMDALAAPGA